ncbi:diaminobutyrate acetyltransferase [Haloechinothrix sp. LS1_15]|uniref:diaminobutyrate acetyltransferase n=1 Tax=Haloechinothrix sp. LS1_15 TaxID=2652248 RepID=UPI0029473ABD|nr:diaminobutyrate acetyltransferase [Haloechinothrix sp. LS1_15]MDV6011936.1 diaminobutyrate acetyltransferase [Haloechinothrix sp. LS1_15]
MSGEVTIGKPAQSDGAALWRVARDSGKLDLNSSYAYLMWCVDFAGTSVVARRDGEVVGFVLGYRKQEAHDTVMVWQVAVDASQRGEGLAGRLLDDLFTRVTAQGVRYLATTVTPDNEASLAMFRSFAARWNAEMTGRELFAASDFPEPHEPEDEYVIGPLAPPQVS